MSTSTYSTTRVILGRLRHGADLLAELTRIANDEQIVTGTITGLGGLKRGAVAFLNQETKEYERIEFNEPMEIVSMIGNISRFKQRAFPHVHVALSNRQGQVFGGHLVQGSEVWACEVEIRELAGPTLSRDFDPETGLSLWKDNAIL